NVNFFPYFNSGNKGIGCGLGPVQKIADGEPLGGQMTAEEAFGGGGAGYTPAAPSPTFIQQPAYPQQQSYAPPAQQVQQPNYPQQPVQPVQPVQIDPITGMPITGKIMGL
ncbi:MAG: DUF2815 family protein, partial [Clostridia bacterium]|nr:DUF2815 family protein [Clostridia bacterium]